MVFVLFFRYTALLATIHPLHIHYEECLSTMHFANRCRNVRNVTLPVTHPAVVYHWSCSSLWSCSYVNKVGSPLSSNTLRTPFDQVRNQPRVNRLGDEGSLDKDKKIRKLLAEVGLLRKNMDGLRLGNRKKVTDIYHTYNSYIG